MAQLQPSEMRNVCCICKNIYVGYGNNAQPVQDGECCDTCNATVVIPERLKVLKN